MGNYPNNPQNKAEFGIITKGKTLVDFTVQVITSSKFPKKYRFVFGNRIMERSLDVLDFVVQANECNMTVQREWEDRQYFQNKALTACKTLLNTIECLFKAKGISYDQCERWTRHVLDVRNMTLAWRNKDRERMKHPQKIPLLS